MATYTIYLKRKPKGKPAFPKVEGSNLKDALRNAVTKHGMSKTNIIGIRRWSKDDKYETHWIPQNM